MLRKAVVLTSSEWDVPGWGRLVLIPRFAPHRSAKLPEPEGFRPGEVRCSTEPIVKEKRVVNLSWVHMYQLLRSTHFEMYLLVILPFDTARGEGLLPCIDYMGMCSLKVYGILRHFGVKLGMVFAL